PANRARGSGVGGDPAGGVAGAGQGAADDRARRGGAAPAGGHARVSGRVEATTHATQTNGRASCRALSDRLGCDGRRRVRVAAVAGAMTEIVLDRRMSCPLFFSSLLNSPPCHTGRL